MACGFKKKNGRDISRLAGNLLLNTRTTKGLCNNNGVRPSPARSPDCAHGIHGVTLKARKDAGMITERRLPIHFLF
jgi:hypothetical protein